MSAAADAERRIRAFEEMGWHRTGWEADNQAADWLIAELQTAGIEARAQPFRAPRWHWNKAEVRVAGHRIIGEPMSDGGPAPGMGVVAPLLREPRHNTMSIIVWQPTIDDPRRLGPEIYDHLDHLEAQGAQGVVLLMDDEDGYGILRNAERPWDPIRLPVLQIAPKEAGPLLDNEGETAGLVITGRREEVQALNVLAEIPGADLNAAPVTLMTPKSGWFTCAAERGGGIAVWLAVAERIAAQRPRRTLQLVASSGHELHHLGLDAYLESLGDAASKVSAWIHLGAAIGAKRGTPSLAASDDELMTIAQSALSASGIERDPFPVGRSGYGEARNIAEIGGRYISLLGGHPYFHSPQDTFDNAVDLNLLTRHINAVETMTRELLA